MEHRNIDMYQIHTIIKKTSTAQKSKGEPFYEIMFKNRNNGGKAKTEVVTTFQNYKNNRWDKVIQCYEEHGDKFVYSFEEDMINWRLGGQRIRWDTFVKGKYLYINADSLPYISGEIKVEVNENHAKKVRKEDAFFSWEESVEPTTTETIVRS